MDTSPVYLLLGKAVISFSLASFLFVLGFCIRRLYFHPLSKYPGPFWAKLTDFHAAYHSWKGDLHIDMWRSHEIYGIDVHLYLCFSISIESNGNR